MLCCLEQKNLEIVATNEQNKAELELRMIDLPLRHLINLSKSAFRSGTVKMPPPT